MLMATELKFKMAYDPYRRGPQSIDGVVDYHVTDAYNDGRGELESMAAAQNELRKIVAFMATRMPLNDQFALARHLGWEEDR